MSKPLALSRIHCFTNDVGTLDFEEAQSTTNMLVLIHLDRQTDRQQIVTLRLRQKRKLITPVMIGGVD